MILKSTLAVVSLVVSGLALAGIEIGAPLVSGQVATFQDRHETLARLSHRPSCKPCLSGWRCTGTVGMECSRKPPVSRQSWPST